MAWSYTAPLKDTGYIDGDDVQVYWNNTWTVKEIPGASAGYIRLALTVSTNGFWTYTKGGYDYSVYCEDTISYGSTKYTLKARRVINNAYNYSATVDIPNSWAGVTVKLNVALRTVSVTLGASKSFTLSTSAGTGANITVQRSSSNVGATGTISNGAVIYNGDALKITFTPSSNYAINTHTVNGVTFTSGNIHSVSTNVSVIATASLVKSTILATDANIGSTTVITITRYNAAYTHTIQYQFESLTGVIASDSSDTTIAWSVPTSFYSQIPNSKTGVCTLICETFNGASSLGSNECTFIVTATESECMPTIDGTVEDVNNDTVALTGDANILIRYKSSAKCVITTDAKNSASISTKTINGQTPDGSNSVTISGDSLSTDTFTFATLDSRGYSNSLILSKTLIPYVKLTLNPVIYRGEPTSNSLFMTLSGNFYSGNFGESDNTLSIYYRYRDTSTSIYSDWLSVNSNGYIIGDNSYYTMEPIVIIGSGGGAEEFSYQKSFVFEVRATDGDGSISLSTVTSTVRVQKGIPVFDWGENDFRFNVQPYYGEHPLVTKATITQIESDVSDLQTYEVRHITGTLTSLPAEFSYGFITDAHRVINCVFCTPSAITSDVTWTTSAGSVVFSGTLMGTTTIDFDIVKVVTP